MTEKQRRTRLEKFLKWMLILYLPVMLLTISVVLEILDPDDGLPNSAGEDGALGMLLMLMMAGGLAGFAGLGIAVIFLTCPNCIKK